MNCMHNLSENERAKLQIFLLTDLLISINIRKFAH